MHAARTDPAKPHEAGQAAAYRVAGSRATDSAGGSKNVHGRALVHAVLGARFATSERGGELLQRYAAWLAFVEAALVTVRELVAVSRLVQVYRAPLRVGRQIPAAAYELHACARLVDVVRRLELHVRTRGRRHADARALFLAQTFHVEVKAHEDRSGRGRRGGVGSAHALWQVAVEQSSSTTANLLVLGHVEPGGVQRLADTVAPGGPFGAVAWLDLRPRSRTWRGAVFRVRDAQHPFGSALFEVLQRRFEHP